MLVGELKKNGQRNKRPDDRQVGTVKEEKGKTRGDKERQRHSLGAFSQKKSFIGKKGN